MKDDLRRILSVYEPQLLDEPGLVPSAVLLLLFERDGEPHIVFQKRSELVLHHKGQVSLPGGAADPGDPDLVYTALRETHEEMGVAPEHIEVFGRLDDIRTITNFSIAPFVGWLQNSEVEWRYPAVEVAYVLEVPVAHLAADTNFVEDRRIVDDGREVVFPSYRFGDDLIWGATARILTNFLDLWRTALLRRQMKAH